MVNISRWCGRAVAGWLAVLLTAAGASGASAQSAQGTSYTLENAIGVALSNNRELRVARLGLESAGQRVREAWGSVLPDIDATVGYTRNLRIEEAFLPAIIFDPTAPPDELVPVRFGGDNDWRAEVRVDQPIFDAGALVGVGAASRFEAREQEIVRGQAQRVASQVRRSYYAVLLARENVRVLDESVGRTEETLRETRALHLAGLSSSYDVLRLDVRLGNLRPSLRRATNAVAAAERDLAVVLGLDEVMPVQVGGELHRIDLASVEANEGPNRELLRLVGYENPLEAAFDELVEIAFRMRSDLRQARLTHELEAARVRFERTSYFPRLSAFFSYGVIAQEDGSLNPFGQRDNQRTTAARLGVMLEVPIFQGFERSARMQQRHLARQQAEVRIGQLEKEMVNEIQTALEALEEAQLRAGSQRQAVGQAHRGYEIVTALYLAGTSSQLDVIDGEVALRESEFNYSTAVYDYLVAHADLDDAVGIVPIVDTPVTANSEVRVSLKDQRTRRGYARHDKQDQ